MFRYLPSKKVFFVAIVAASVLVLAMYTDNAKELRLALKNQPFLSHTAFTNTFYSDTDEDGLSDWKETLFGTDVNDPDSNNNGIADGDELINEKPTVNLFATDSVYSSLTELGNALQSVPDPLETLSKSPIVYDNIYIARNLHTVPSEVSAYEEYITSLFMTLSKNTASLEEEPLDIIKDWLQTYSQKHLDKLNAISVANKKTAEELMAINVPNDFAKVHLDIANNLYKTGLSLDNIESTTLDPTGGFFAAANYANYQSKYVKGVFELIEQAVGDNNNG